MGPEDAKHRFIRLANSWNTGSRFLIRRFIAVRTSVHWQLRYAINVISGDLTGEFQNNKPLPLRIETNSILSAREIITLTNVEVANLIRQINNDPCTLHLSQENLSLLSDNDSKASYNLDPIAHPQFAGRQRWPTLTASISPADIPKSLIDKRLLDLELNASSTPYFGLDDLCGEMSFPLTVLDSSRPSLVEWVIVPPAIIKSDS
jgi:hypothetical protein